MKTYLLKTEDGIELKIAENRGLFLDSLFAPGGTFDGYISKRTKNNIFFFTHYKNKEYGVNRHGVLFKVCPKRDGEKQHYQHAVLDFDYKSQRIFAENLLATLTQSN